MSEGNYGAGNLIWAIAQIIIAGTYFYGGFLSGNKKHEIDVEVKVPGATNSN
jgi:hypothetical protein